MYESIEGHGSKSVCPTPYYSHQTMRTVLSVPTTMIDLTFKESLLIAVMRRLLSPIERLFSLFNMPSVAGVERDIVYATHSCVPLKLDVIKPLGEAPHPIVMMIHGGGFIGGDKGSLDRTCRTFANHGFLTFNINYRLAPEYPHPAQVTDCAAALQWVKEHAEKYGGDINRICVGGGSAGGYLASALAVKAQDGPYHIQPHPLGEQDSGLVDGSFTASLLLNGVFDIEKIRESGFPQVHLMIKSFLGDNVDDEDEIRTASPLNFVNEKYPTAFIAVGAKDKLLGESQHMREVLGGYGVDVDYSEYEGSGHGWFNFFWTDNAKAAHSRMLDWLNKTLK